MSVFKRGNVYWYNFIFHGRRIQQTTRQASKRVAERLEMEHKLSLQRGEIGLKEQVAPRFKEAMAKYLDWKLRMMKPRTYKLAKTCNVKLSLYFGDRRINAISVNDVLAYQQTRSEQKRVNTKRTIKPAMVNRELGLMRAMYNYWHRQGVRIDNPVSKVKFHEEDANIFHVLTPDEERYYLLTASQPLKDVATIILRTAMRPGEVFALKKKDVNLQQGWLQVEAGKTRSARRKLALGAEVRKILVGRMLTTSEYLFPQRGSLASHLTTVKKAHIATLAAAAAKQAKDSGKPVKPYSFRLYDLRHTAATRLAEQGTDLVTLAAILGHSKVQMVFRYAHPIEAAKTEAILKLNSEKVMEVAK